MSREKFYITTAIDYVNAKVHLGHSLEKIQADVLARYHRILGKDVFFLTGTDENAQKNVLAAEKEGISPKKFVDQNANFAKNLWKKFNISFDYFIRTTNKKIHWPGVKKLWLKCKEAGDIYKKSYTGLYCSGCEAFLREKDLKDGLCPYHLKKPEVVSEENYFFRLSKYQKELEKIIERDEIEIFPKERKNEVLSFIMSGLEDFSISRPKERMKGWGIPVPGDRSQIIYVWFDALTNYISAIGYGRDEKTFKKYWPADLHIIGKDILKFHAIYWPAMLLSAKIELPRRILVHGFITVAGQKMSKSLGNIINPLEIIEKYGADSLRYFLLRESPPFEDLDFTFEKFKKKYNSDLAAGIGNLVARVTTMAKKFKIQNSTPHQSRARCGVALNRASHWFRAKFKMKIQNSKLEEEIEKTKRSWKDALENFKFNEALKSIWDLISFCDKFIQEKRPWERGNEKSISDLLFALKEISKMLYPFLPETSQKILKQIEIKKSQILFPMIK
jgi:methionyl-tRNA synthetase